MLNNFSNSKHLAKNTAYMYVRMVVMMLISLYSSRVLLKALGVEDYGIYNLVGSIVAMFESLKVLFATSTQRFLNYEMGRGNTIQLTKVFNTSLIINTVIAFVFFVIVEIVGLWFLESKINVPSSRLYAAHIVFQTSLLVTIIGIIATSYDAVVIAHERFNFYAVFSIIEATLRLLCILSIGLFPKVDNLVYYAIGILCLSVIMRFALIVYCRRFDECHLSFNTDSQLLKQMTKFAGWNFFGNTAYSLTQNGLNLILNMFGGPIVNAARGITYQIMSASNQCLSCVTMVIKPYSMRAYGAGQFESMFNIMYLSSKILFLIQILILIPIYWFTYEILHIWLGEFPEFTIAFVQIAMFYSLIRAIHGPLDTIFLAHGNIGLYQMTEGVILSLPLVVTYFALKKGLPYYSMFYIMLLFECINLIVVSIEAKNIVGLNLRKYFASVLIPCCISALLVIFIYIIFKSDNVIINILFALLSCFLVCSIMYLIGLTSKEKEIIKGLLKKNKK